MPSIPRPTRSVVFGLTSIRRSKNAMNAPTIPVSTAAVKIVRCALSSAGCTGPPLPNAWNTSSAVGAIRIDTIPTPSSVTAVRTRFGEISRKTTQTSGSENSQPRLWEVSVMPARTIAPPR